jgi:hypothetical protein
MSTEERADYLMEAFLDEQNTLIRPLVSRKLHLVKVLDERSTIVERILDDKRRKLLQKKSLSLVAEIESLEDELEQLATEKVTVLHQLMDLVKRPYDTILEVEGALKVSGLAHASSPAEGGPATGALRSKKSTANSDTPPPVTTAEDDLELWCYCRKPDDGRPMVACDNSKCDIVWWHLDCVERYAATHHVGAAPSDDSRKWDCPVCLAQEIVKQEADRNRRVTTKRR